MSSRETERVLNQESMEDASEYGHAMRGNAVISKFNYTTVFKVDKILANENLANLEDDQQNQLPFLKT